MLREQTRNSSEALIVDIRTLYDAIHIIHRYLAKNILCASRFHTHSSNADRKDRSCQNISYGTAQINTKISVKFKTGALSMEEVPKKASTGCLQHRPHDDGLPCWRGSQTSCPNCRRGIAGRYAHNVLLGASTVDGIMPRTALLLFVVVSKPGPQQGVKV